MRWVSSFATGGSGSWSSSASLTPSLKTEDTAICLDSIVTPPTFLFSQMCEGSLTFTGSRDRLWEARRPSSHCWFKLRKTDPGSYLFKHGTVWWKLFLWWLTQSCMPSEAYLSLWGAKSAKYHSNIIGSKLLFIKLGSIEWWDKQVYKNGLVGGLVLEGLQATQIAQRSPG